jgi:hypothetical protein
MTTSHQKEQAERKRLAGSTGQVTNYRDWAVNDIALESRGRHSAAAKATVTGSARVPQVPRMPEGSPWAGDLVPPEEALGWSVEAQEPTGNYHEIEESLAASSAFHSLGAEDAAAARLGPLPCGAQTPTSTGSCLPREVGVPLRRGRRL